MKKCPKCGKLTDSSFRFCPACGQDLADVSEADPAGTEPAQAEPAETETIDIAPVSNGPDNEIDESTESLALPGADPETTADPESAACPEPAASPEPVANQEPAANQEPVTDQAAAAAPLVKGTPGQNSKKKLGLIVGGVIAVIAIVAVILLSNKPKPVSIEAEYYGPVSKGTVVSDSSDITVIATFDDDSTKEVTGWSVDEITIKPGFNDVDVTYEELTTSFSVYSPLMSGGKYVATVDEINDVLYGYNKKYVDGFTGFTKDSKVGGQYNYDGAKLDLNVSYTKRSGSENIAAEEDEVPDTVIVSMMLRADDFGDNLDRIYSAGAAAFTAVDPEINYDDAYSQIKEGIYDAVHNGEGSYSIDEKNLDNLNLATGMVLANNNLLIFFSFKSF